MPPEAVPPTTEPERRAYRLVPHNELTRFAELNPDLRISRDEEGSAILVPIHKDHYERNFHVWTEDRERAVVGTDEEGHFGGQPGCVVVSVPLDLKVKDIAPEGSSGARHFGEYGVFYPDRDQREIGSTRKGHLARTVPEYCTGEVQGLLEKVGRISLAGQQLVHVWTRRSIIEAIDYEDRTAHLVTNTQTAQKLFQKNPFYDLSKTEGTRLLGFTRPDYSTIPAILRNVRTLTFTTIEKILADLTEDEFREFGVDERTFLDQMHQYLRDRDMQRVASEQGLVYFAFDTLPHGIEAETPMQRKERLEKEKVTKHR